MRALWTVKREHYLGQSGLSLLVAIAAVVLLLPLYVITFLLQWAICGDASGCNAYPIGIGFAVLAVLLVLIAVAGLLRALILFVLAVGARWSRRTPS